MNPETTKTARLTVVGLASAGGKRALMNVERPAIIKRCL